MFVSWLSEYNSKQAMLCFFGILNASEFNKEYTNLKLSLVAIEALWEKCPSQYNIFQTLFGANLGHERQK